MFVRPKCFLCIVNKQMKNCRQGAEKRIENKLWPLKYFWFDERGVKLRKGYLNQQIWLLPPCINYSMTSTVWKFQDFSGTQILCEINFGNFEVPKTTLLTIWATLNFVFWGTFGIFKCENFSRNQESKPPKLLKWQFRPSEIS